ncbi:MAG: hypothetical protein QM305_09655 [Bacteroidota bacterium]|nr:hypothetical protein [Bacteroidota bacterium]
MNEKEKRPDVGASQQQGEIPFMFQDKDTPKLSKRQRKVYELLRTGKHSAADISIKLGYCDPRSHISILREKGITVLDEWVQPNDTRFKRYWI